MDQGEFFDGGATKSKGGPGTELASGKGRVQNTKHEKGTSVWTSVWTSNIDTVGDVSMVKVENRMN